MSGPAVGRRVGYSQAPQTRPFQPQQQTLQPQPLQLQANAATLQARQLQACSQPQTLQPRPVLSQQRSPALEPRRLVARVGADPGELPSQQPKRLPVEGRSAPQPGARTLRFADEVSELERLPPQRFQQPPTPSLSDDAFKVASVGPGQQERRGGIAKSALRRGSDAGCSNSAASACTTVAPCRQELRHPDASANGSAQSSANGLGPARVAQKRSLPEPELLVVRFLYLSRLPTGSWLQNPAQYQLSLHVGEDARSDPPPQPGVYCTPLVQAGPPQAVAPEEAHLKQQILKAIDAMREQESQAAEGQPSEKATDAGQYVECRMKVRLTVRLSEAGPGPAAGGPVYFRVDAWSVGSDLLGRKSQPQLFARAFVPINEPKYHRRSCTWPMIDRAGQDCAYVTCEFSFARVPGCVQGLQASSCTESEVRLQWFPPEGEDKVVPVQGYRVEARFVGRGRQRGGAIPSTPWQHVGDVDVRKDLGILAQDLKPDSRYVFRVAAVNEVGLGDLMEVEATTAPCAPAGCGQPRLAGCSGPVLAVEWDPPAYDGGADLVAYRVWVRPFTASEVDPRDWLEVGHVKHKPAGVQRAEIHTEDLDPSIGRYLCRVAAINAAGEAGPPTPEGVCLMLPNPCSVSKPVPVSGAGLALTDRKNSLSMDLWPQAMDGGLLTMTINEPGKRQVTVPLLQDDFIGGAHDVSIGLLESPNGRGNSRGAFDVSYAGQDLALPDDLEGTYGNWPVQLNAWDRRASEDSSFGAIVPVRSAGSPKLGAANRHQPSQEVDQQAVVGRMLDEKRTLLDDSLQRYRQLAEQLSRSPDSEMLRQRLEEAEIEAAGYQAEVAVLSQKLSDLMDAMRAPPVYNSGNEQLSGLLFRD
eukprot:TRINITY_DN96061_c0_g1_i1.p1 TRINITY_DN96061_c0_g1~~TRINITY_DN96061_c0_g1_i1.p1  ORF type:complete len:867 (+),score=142.56 TRINITY_DN96061_c0_g1_i1:41-2641(+)